MPQDYHIVVSNPTASAVSSDGHVAPARSVKILHIDSATASHYKDFLDGGCSIGPYTGATMRERQQGGYLLHMLQGRMSL